MLKTLDLQICSELLKNSKVSDRELARKLGVSQPTITRRRAKLERIQVIREYTFIPDFPKLGYHILAITLLKYSPDLDMKQIQEIRKKAQALVKGAPLEMVMAERGSGLDYDGMVMSDCPEGNCSPCTTLQYCLASFRRTILYIGYNFFRLAKIALSSCCLASVCISWESVSHA